MKFLGIDPGTRYVGLAMADEQVKIAMPYQVLDIKDQNLLFQELEKIVAKEKIQKIIVGYPLGMSGKPTEQTKITEQFIKELKEFLNVPIIRFDERLSSKMVDKMSFNKNKNHAGAASIILQDYLDKN